MPFTVRLMVSACSESSVLIADSTLVTISVAGMFDGVIAKFNPFFSNDTSASLRGRVCAFRERKGHIWSTVNFFYRDPHWYTRRAILESKSVPAPWIPTIKQYNNRSDEWLTLKTSAFHLFREANLRLQLSFWH